MWTKRGIAYHVIPFYKVGLQGAEHPRRARFLGDPAYEIAKFVTGMTNLAFQTAVERNPHSPLGQLYRLGMRA